MEENLKAILLKFDKTESYSFLKSCYQKAHDLNKSSAKGASSKLAGFIMYEYNLQEFDTLLLDISSMLLEEAKSFAIYPDYRKYRDDRINQLVFASILDCRKYNNEISIDWILQKMKENNITSSQICEKLGFDNGDFSNYMAGKKQMPKARRMLLYYFFT